MATSHRIDKYGGLQLTDRELAAIVDALNAGVPMHGHHDVTRPIRTRDMSAGLVTLDDDERAARLVGLGCQADWDAAGPAGGMSFSMTHPLVRVEGPNGNPPTPQGCVRRVPRAGAAGTIDLMKAMADLGPGPHRSDDIAGGLGVRVESVAPRRSALITTGMIYSPAHG